MAKSILTITLNPSVDKSTSVQHIVPEKKLRCEKPIYQPGGGGINVSRALKRLGLDSTALFTSGGKTGSLLESLLKLEDIAIDPIRVNGETRENFIVVDSSTNQQYRFGFPGEQVESNELDGIRTSIEELTSIPDFVVISGSMPAGMPPELTVDDLPFAPSVDLIGPQDTVQQTGQSVGQRHVGSLDQHRAELFAQRP